MYSKKTLPKFIHPTLQIEPDEKTSEFEDIFDLTQFSQPNIRE